MYVEFFNNSFFLVDQDPPIEISVSFPIKISLTCERNLTVEVWNKVTSIICYSKRRIMIVERINYAVNKSYASILIISYLIRGNFIFIIFLRVMTQLLHSAAILRFISPIKSQFHCTEGAPWNRNFFVRESMIA